MNLLGFFDPSLVAPREGDALVDAVLNARIENVLPRLPGWCSIEKGQIMAKLVRDMRAECVVEFGVYGGRSLIAIAEGLRANGKGLAVGYDPYVHEATLGEPPPPGKQQHEHSAWWAGLKYEEVFAGAQNAIEQYGLAAYAKIVRERGMNVVDQYEDGSIDLCHQDANHSEVTSTEEVLAWASKIRRGGYWVADDTDWPSTRKAQNILAERFGPPVIVRQTWAIYKNGEA